MSIPSQNHPNDPSCGATPARLGFHYYDDASHYRQSDLERWLPVLVEMGASWLALQAPIDRAIPEAFITGLLQAGVTPLLHFQLPLTHELPPEDCETLFAAYAKWGVRSVVLFDRPNLRVAWPIHNWAQTDLVERFLDIYLPVAESARQAGLTPIFPPLEPGGDYWDTAFLRAALHGIQRRGHRELLQNLGVAAYAWADEHPLDWGAGGPERWPAARPYFTPADQQDQRGFYIFDWYQAIVQAVLGAPRPIFLLAGGFRRKSNSARELDQHTYHNMEIIRRLQGDEEAPQAAISSQVTACCFWLLSSTLASPNNSQAWFPEGEEPLPIVNAMQEWGQARQAAMQAAAQEKVVTPAFNQSSDELEAEHFSIEHYLLLPSYDWGVSDWHLEAIRPFIKKYRPTVGFSPHEASLARRVTVIGGETIYTEELLTQMRSAGSVVERISGNGTEIASQLANR